MNTQEHTSPKNERIAARVSQEHKSLFEKAARLRGVSLTEFMTYSAYETALKVLEQHETILHLNATDSAQFFDSIMQIRNMDALPNLKDAFQGYTSGQG